jgi:hypothetical protein
VGNVRSERKKVQGHAREGEAIFFLRASKQEGRYGRRLSAIVSTLVVFGICVVRCACATSFASCRHIPTRITPRIDACQVSSEQLHRRDGTWMGLIV